MYPLSDIPEELLLRIFTYFDEQDLCRVAQVCRKFYHLTDDPALWKRLYRRVFSYQKPLLRIAYKDFGFIDPSLIYENPLTGEIPPSNLWKESFGQMYQEFHVVMNKKSTKEARRLMNDTRPIFVDYNEANRCRHRRTDVPFRHFLFIHATNSQDVEFRKETDNVIVVVDRGLDTESYSEVIQRSGRCQSTALVLYQGSD